MGAFDDESDYSGSYDSPGGFGDDQYSVDSKGRPYDDEERSVDSNGVPYSDHGSYDEDEGSFDEVGGPVEENGIDWGETAFDGNNGWEDASGKGPDAFDAAPFPTEHDLSGSGEDLGFGDTDPFLNDGDISEGTGHEDDGLGISTFPDADDLSGSPHRSGDDEAPFFNEASFGANGFDSPVKESPLNGSYGSEEDSPGFAFNDTAGDDGHSLGKNSKITQQSHLTKEQKGVSAHPSFNSEMPSVAVESVGMEQLEEWSPLSKSKSPTSSKAHPHKYEDSGDQNIFKLPYGTDPGDDPAFDDPNPMQQSAASESSEINSQAFKSKDTLVDSMLSTDPFSNSSIPDSSHHGQSLTDLMKSSDCKIKGSGRSVHSKNSRSMASKSVRSSASKSVRSSTSKRNALASPQTPGTPGWRAQFNRYSREQMDKLVASPPLSMSPKDKSKRKKKRRQKINVKSDALLDLVASVNETMHKMEEDLDLSKHRDDVDIDASAPRLLLGFEALVGIYLQLSDELELMSTFSRHKDAAAITALEKLLSFAPLLDDVFSQMRPVLQEYMVEDPDEEMNDFLCGMDLIVDLLCELTHKVGVKQAWNERTNTAYVTMLELLSRDLLEVTSIFDDVDTPQYELSTMLQEAWSGTGHVEEFKTLQVTDDLALFRQLCYEVVVSTDTWCPEIETLMDICGIEPDTDKDAISPTGDEEIADTPETALQVLQKVTKKPLPRVSLLASVLRRILPPSAITDKRLLDTFASIRTTIRNPLGLSTSNLIAISSVAEDLGDPDSLGVAGVGKSTLAAMVADHVDVRRHFIDGVAWIHVGQQEFNYIRYIQCLHDLVSQLDVSEDEEPLFPELLHTPGESKAKRRRREEGFMIYVREIMVEFLQYRNVLIILDDVCFEPDLDWFDFDPAQPEDDGEEFSCVVLVTTRCRTLLPAADTVEVDLLEEKEAVSLFISESGELSSSLSAKSPEVQAVALECANHPLAVKSVGRWLNLKHATAEATDNPDEIQEDVVRSMEKILKGGSQDDTDMLFEIMDMSLSPAVNGEPTNIIKFCYAAFVLVFCDRQHLSDFALADATPVVPLGVSEMLFESLLDLEEETLLKEGSLFYAQKHDAAALIPEALSALGVVKVIVTSPETEADSKSGEEVEEKYLQVMHRVQQEYGEFLYSEDMSMVDLTRDCEKRWNRAFSQTFLSQEIKWDEEFPDAALDYALEMLPCHMIRGGMLSEVSELLVLREFVKGRLFALGRENGTRRHIKDCETLFDALAVSKPSTRRMIDAKATMKASYLMLGSLVVMDDEEYIAEEGSPEAVEVGRAHFELGFSLAEKRCWEAAIAHWDTSQELFVSSLGMVEVVAGILYNVGVVYAGMNEYEQALGALKQCLRIRGAIHGEEHILYAQTIQKIGDVFLAMSDYHEAMESYNWAIDVMHIEPSHHRIDIGDILENMGNIHYSKGEIDDSLQCYQDALRSKQVDLGEDHPELASMYHHIGNCLSDQGKTDEAIAHLELAIKLKELDPDGGAERDSDVLTIKGVLHNLHGRPQDGLECYEKSLQILVTKVPHKKEKIASLLHLIGCVYLMSGEHKKAMKLFEESLQARRKVLGFVHLDVASTLFNMAFLHQTRNRLDKALKCLEEALKIRQLRLPDSEKVAVTHEKIGTLARSIGKSKKAEIAFGEALRIRKLLHGDNHATVATVLQELGDLMDDLGESEDAMRYYGEALGIRNKCLGPDDLAVAETLYSMGFTLQNNGSFDRALDLLEESLNIRRFQLGEDAKEVGDTLNMIGFIQVKRGELDDSLSMLWDALRIRKLQDDHIKVSETLKNIGNVHREKQELDLAVECYEECLRIRREKLGDEHEKVADALIALGNVRSDMDESEEAMYCYKEGMCQLRVKGHSKVIMQTMLIVSSPGNPVVGIRRTERKSRGSAAVHGNP